MFVWSHYVMTLASPDMKRSQFLSISFDACSDFARPNNWNTHLQVDSFLLAS